MINKRKDSKHQQPAKSRFRHMIVSNWYVFLISITFFLGGTYVYMQLAPPKYEVSASVLLNSPSKDAKTIEVISGKLEILRSDTLIAEAVSSYHEGVIYYQNQNNLPAFLKDFTKREVSNFPYLVQVKHADKRFYDTPLTLKVIGDKQYRILIDVEDGAKLAMEGTFGKELNAEGLSLTINRKEHLKASDDLDYSFQLQNQSKLLSHYAASLDVAPIELEGSPLGLLKLTHKTANFDGGVNFLNHYIELCRTSLSPLPDSTKDVNIQMLDNKIRILQDSLNRTENLRDRLQEEKNGPSADTSNDDLRASLSASLKKSLSKIQSYRSLKNILLSGESRRKSELLRLIESDDADTRKWLDVYFNNTEKLDELLLDVTKNHPLAISVQQKIENARERIVNQTNIFVDKELRRAYTLRKRISYLGPAESEVGLQDSLQSVEKRLASVSATLQALQAERSKVQALLANSESLEIVSPPANSSREPVWPAEYLYVFAVLLGTVLPIMILSLKKGNNANIILDKDELLSHSKAPLLGMISKGSKNTKLISSRDSNSPVFQSFKFLGLNLSYIEQKGSCNVIGFTSSVSGEGRTFCSVNLAATMARAANKTLLINLDQGSSGIQSFLKLKQLGLSHFLMDYASLSNIIQPSGLKNLDVIAPGNQEEIPNEDLYPEKIAEILKYSRAHYDYIFVKTPPITESYLHFELASHFDINLFLVRYNYTRKDTLSGITDLYLNKKIRNLYLLFNDVEFHSQQEIATPLVTIPREKIKNDELRKESSSPTPTKLSGKISKPPEEVQELPAQSASARYPSVTQTADKKEKSQSEKPKPVIEETNNYLSEGKTNDSPVETKENGLHKEPTKEKKNFEILNRQDTKPLKIRKSSSSQGGTDIDKSGPQAAASNDKPVTRKHPDQRIPSRERKQFEGKPADKFKSKDEPFPIPIKPNPLREEIERKRLAQMKGESQNDSESSKKLEKPGRIEASPQSAAPRPFAKEDPRKTQDNANEESKIEAPKASTAKKEQPKPKTVSQLKSQENGKNNEDEDFTPPGTILPHEEYEEPGFFNRLLGKKKKKKTVYKNPFA